MALAWDNTEFLMPDAALSVDHADVAITVVIHDDYSVIGWSVKVSEPTNSGTRSLPWPDVERIAKEVAEKMGEWFHGEFDYTPDGE